MPTVEGSKGGDASDDALSASEVIDLITDFERRIAHLSFADVTRGALEFMSDRLGVTRVSVTLLEADGQTFRMFDSTTMVRGIESGKQVPHDSGSLGTTVDRCQPTYRPDISKWPRMNDVDKALQAAGYRSSFSVPLLCGGRCLGTLNVAERTVDGVGPGKRKLIELIAPRMAFAILVGLTHDELAESEARFREVFAQVGDGVVVASVADRRIVMANPAMCAMLGRASNDLLGATIEVIHPADSIDDILTMFAAAMEGRLEHVLEIPMIRADGTVFAADVAARPTTLSGKSCVVGVFRDAESRRRREREQVQIQKLESIRTLAAGIAHDFNNLLTGLIGYMSLVRPHLPVDSEPWEMLGEAHRVAMGASSLTRQLLTFAKGGTPLRKNVDLVRTVRDAANLAVSGTSLRCEFELPGSNVFVLADDGQLAQVVQNLVRNAVEAMPGGGTLRIRISVGPGDRPGAGEQAIIEVSDTGLGIAPELLDRIFIPFFTTKPGGSGLGLAVADSIVHGHGGKISVASAQDSGTTFTIRLPVVSPPEKAERPATSNPPVTTRILIMDDQPAVRFVADRALRAGGYQTFLAVDGSEAVTVYREALAEHRPFDVVILDLTVPGGMGGREAAAAILALEPGAKLIVSSGYSDDAVMSDYRSHGFSAVLPKPFDAEQLRATVAQVLPR